MSYHQHVHCGHDGDGLCCLRCMVGPPDGVFAPNGETSAPAGSSRSDANSDAPAPLLSLEDRVLVCLAARGSKRIGQFIEESIPWDGPDLYGVSDEELVRLLEEHAFYGDDVSVPASADAGRVRGPRRVPPSEPDSARGDGVEPRPGGEHS